MKQTFSLQEQNTIDSLESAFGNFRERTADTITTEDYDPIAIGAELFAVFRDHDINPETIFSSPKHTKALLSNATVGGYAINDIYIDQLYHAIIGSTRTPCHAISGALLTDPQDWKKHGEVIDIAKLARIIVSEKT